MPSKMAVKVKMLYGHTISYENCSQFKMNHFKLITFASQYVVFIYFHLFCSQSAILICLKNCHSGYEKNI